LTRTRCATTSIVIGAILAAAIIVNLIVAQEPGKKKTSPAVDASGMTTDRGGIPGKLRAMDDGKHCGGRTLPMGQSITLEELAGGKVKTIRLVSAEELRGWTPKEAREVVEKVWSKQFGWMACQIQWDEGFGFAVEAVLDFEDGKQGLMITDGTHVGLQDHEGNHWFLR